MLSETRRSHSLGSPTSATAATALTPQARTASQTFCIPSSREPLTTTLAPACASPTAMPAPSPVREPVTRAFLPLRLNRSRIILLVAGFQARPAGSEARLHIDYAELAVQALAMRRHGPQETHAMAGDRDVGVIARRHE